MQVPSFLQGERPIDLFKGALVGGIATLIVGFYWGGWTLGSTAKQMAEKSATTAVVAVLAPICVDKFQHAADAAANLVEFKKVSTWQQSSFIEKGGWATQPGSDRADSAVATACATMLGNLKQVAILRRLANAERMANNLGKLVPGRGEDAHGGAALTAAFNRQYPFEDVLMSDIMESGEMLDLG